MPPTIAKSFRARWGHRRTSSVPVNELHRIPTSQEVAPTLTKAAAALSPNNKRNVSSPLATITVEEEREGLNQLTMTSAEDAGNREVSFSNAGLPTMYYERSVSGPPSSMQTRSSFNDFIKPRASTTTEEIPEIVPPTPAKAIQRTLSDPGMKFNQKSDNETKQILAYWKIEKELRVAQDALQKKCEEMKDMEAYKTNLTREMDDLTGTLFEEAHEMVRVEKEARHKDNVLLKETNDKSHVLQEELKALKLIVASQAKITKRGSKVNISTGPPPEPESSVDSEWVVDTMLFNEFMKWHLQPSLEEDTIFMKRVISEDIRPCLRFHAKTAKQSIALLKVIKENNLVIEEIQATKEELCSLSLHKRQCNFRLKSLDKVEPDEEGDADVCALVGEGKEWLHICGPVRNRIICVCNFYTYIRYVVQGIVKAKIADVYWRLVDLRLQINKARLGFPVNGGN